MNDADKDHSTGTDPGSEEVTAESGSGSERTGLVFGVLFWVAIGAVIALSNDASRAWIETNWKWFAPVAAVAVVVAIVGLVAVWAKKKSSNLRATVYLLVVVPVVGFGTATIFMLPTAAQLVTLRAVALSVLVMTPALMWWLFIATQRASLLNEFIANLDRLGLLDADSSDDGESAPARETRISSYLQKFEATYGALPEQIRHDVVDGNFRSYSTEEARDRTSLTAAAVPVTLVLVTFLVGWILVLPPVDSFPDEVASPRWLLALSPNATPVTFAFLGAYFFSMQMLFRRYVRGDLRGSAYVAVVLRVVLAVVGIWVLQGVGEEAGWTSPSQLLVIAFVVGVFPVVVWQVISGAASQVFDAVLPSLQSRLPLNQLDGLTVWHEARLEEEDVENVQNMATADIVDLLVNTRIPVARLVDWIDQAILLTQLGPDVDPDSPRRMRLAQCGIRSASALLQAADGRAGADLAVLDRSPADDGSSALSAVISCIRTNDNLAQVLRWKAYTH